MSDGLLRTRDALAAGEVSSVELVTAALDRIEATRETLNAFRCVRTERAAEEAAAADERLAAGERLPLLGVPVAVKDDVDLAGETTAFGCGGDFVVAERDSEVARRLRAAGAVIVGKTTTPEFGQWPFTSSTSCGTTRNPWNLAYTPGGSSGGAAAAVAAGLVPGAIGSDGAGSVRIPAAWTNLVGIKPQRGRVSTWPDIDAFNGLTCFGPLARTVADAAHMLDVVTGNHAEDTTKPPPPDEPFAVAAAREPGPLRIGLTLRAPFSGAPWTLAPVVRVAIERLAGVLEDLGHHVERVEPHYGLIGASFLPRSTAALADWEQRVPDPALLDPRTRGNAHTGRRLRPLLGVARAVETLHHKLVGSVFGKVDVLLAPTTATPPPRVDAIDGLSGWETDKVIVGACPFSWAWNVLGWPGVNVPAGLTEDQLPLGAQLLGPANSEGLLLSLAAQLEAVERWDERRPRLPVGAEG